MSTTKLHDLYGDDEHPAAYDDTPTPLVLDAPDTPERAAWHLREIARLEDERDRITNAFNGEIRRLRQRRDVAIATIDRQLAWHRTPLEQYHAARLALDPKAKTIVLPGGTLRSRTPKEPTVVVQDTGEFVSWAGSNAHNLLRINPSPDRDALKTAIANGILRPAGDPDHGEVVAVATADGEVVPGIGWKLGERLFTVVTEGSEW